MQSNNFFLRLANLSYERHTVFYERHFQLAFFLIKKYGNNGKMGKIKK